MTKTFTTAASRRFAKSGLLVMMTSGITVGGKFVWPVTS
jgi:hypothetical protein